MRAPKTQGWTPRVMGSCRCMLPAHPESPRPELPGHASIEWRTAEVSDDFVKSEAHCMDLWHLPQLR